MEDPVVPLERNLYGHPLAGLLWERQFEKILLKHGWEKFQIGNVFVHREKGLFLSVYVDDIKLTGKCGEVGLVKRLHLLFGEVHSVATALKVVEEVQEEVQEIERE